MKEMKYQARQGDVFIVNSNSPNLRPETKKRLFGTQKKTKVDFKKENCLPLAYGEKSGHKHRFEDGDVAELLVNQDVLETVKQLKVKGDAKLVHEEHEAIKVAKGDNATINQVEYRLQTIRRVLD